MAIGLKYFGFVGALVYAYVIRKTKQYKLIAVIMLLISSVCESSSSILVQFLFFLALGTWILLMDTGIFVLPFLGISLFGFFSLGATPLAMEFGAELAYPGAGE